MVRSAATLAGIFGGIAMIGCGAKDAPPPPAAQAGAATGAALGSAISVGSATGPGSATGAKPGATGSGSAGGSDAASTASTAKLALTSLEVKGGLDAEVIRQHLTRNFGQLAACYDHATAAQPALAGTSLLSFEVTGTGIVPLLRSTGFPAVAACINQLSLGEFPRGANAQPTQVKATITFSR